MNGDTYPYLANIHSDVFKQPIVYAKSRVSSAAV